MYNQFPYMMPGSFSQAAPLANGLSNLGTAANLSKASSAASALGKINWSSLLTNAQKTLNVVNQAIPLYYQVKPVFQNIRTLGKIGKEFMNSNIKSDNSNRNINSNSNNNNINTTSQETNTNIDEISSAQERNTYPEPTFFL